MKVNWVEDLSDLNWKNQLLFNRKITENRNKDGGSKKIDENNNCNINTDENSKFNNYFWIRINTKTNKWGILNQVLLK